MLNVFGGTDIGLVRESNQDRYEYAILSDRLAFAVLCDGMGGQNGGNIASETATRFVADMLMRDLKPDLSEGSLRAIMTSAAAGANALVFDCASKNPELKGMGTTLIIAVIADNLLYIVYVGDSRVYIVSDKKEQQLTKDHTVVQMLVDIGEITEQDAQIHPKRHYITRAIGVAPVVDVDFIIHPFGKDEFALLSSDGLYHYLDPDCLYRLISSSVKTQSVDEFLSLAKERGGADNITVVVMGYTQ